MDLSKLKEELRRDEGFRSHAYKDHLGFLTIGIGRLIDHRRGGGITEEEAEYLLQNDIQKVVAALDKKLPWFKNLSDARQRALINMAFQLGVEGLMAFKKTLRALEVGHYERAAIEVLDSKYYQQTPERAWRVAAMLREG